MTSAYNPHRRAAVIFDFDDTLAPDSPSLLLAKHGIDPATFWTQEAAPLVKRGYDPTLAWLKLFLDRIGPDRTLGSLRRGDLQDFGRGIRDKLFPGVDALSADLKTIGQGFDWKVDLFVVSGGLEDVVRGALSTELGFTDVYGCLLEEGGDPPRLQSIMRAVTFTEKTRYLFEISKGISSKETLEKPYAVNKEMADERRPIPLDCMVYVGDGLTDIPCFSLLTDYGGFPFGVFDPSKESSAKKAFRELAVPRRTLGVHSPRYRKTDDLGAQIREAVVNICGRESVGR